MTTTAVHVDTDADAAEVIDLGRELAATVLDELEKPTQES